jgi:hypothetical protein
LSAVPPAMPRWLLQRCSSTWGWRRLRAWK